MKVINKLVDFAYDIFEYIILLLIIALAVLVIIWQFNLMENKSLVRLNQSPIELTESTNLNPSLEGREVEIVIPQGTSPSGIVNILDEYGLADDRQNLLQKMEGISDDKLPSGSFKIPLGSSSEDLQAILGI